MPVHVFGLRKLERQRVKKGGGGQKEKQHRTNELTTK